MMASDALPAAEEQSRWRDFPTYIVVFLAPATIVYTLFMVYPLIDSIRLSFYGTAEDGQFFFVGLENYVTMMTDAIWSEPFWNALKNNFIFFLMHMLVQNPIGLMLAAFSACLRSPGAMSTEL